jgi:hypothetical protein
MARVLPTNSAGGAFYGRFPVTTHDCGRQPPCRSCGVALGLVAYATTGGPRQAREVDPAYRRTVVTYDTREAPGTIVVDPTNHFLYAVQRGGQAVRYGVGVGRTPSPSAWTARAPGATTSWSNGCGARSNSRRSISELTKRSATPTPLSVAISVSTIPEDRIRALTDKPRMPSISPSRHFPWQLNRGRCSTYRAGIPVRTIQASSKEGDRTGLYVASAALASRSAAGVAHLRTLIPEPARPEFR